MPEIRGPSGRTTRIGILLQRLLQDEPSARKELNDYVWRRFRNLTRKMLHGDGVHDQEQTDAVFNAVWIEMQADLDNLANWIKAEEKHHPREFGRHLIVRVGTMIRHSITDLGRRRKRHKTTFVRIDLDRDAAYLPKDLWVRDDVQQKLAELPAEEQELVEMCDYAGLSFVEAASFLGVHSKTVSRRHAKVIGTLRRTLKDFGPNP